MKKILKMIVGLGIGIAAGLLIGLSIGVLFSDKSWSEAFSNLMNISSHRLFGSVVWALIGTVVGFLVQLIVHEGGHLVAGLLTGYRFVSFRIFNLTLIKRDGHFMWRKFYLSGTGGQCLMAPPLRPLSDIDTRWYNLGGVLANVILSTIAVLVMYFFDLPMWAEMMLMMLAMLGYIMALTNGIPLKIGGINNDGFNLFYLEKSPRDKKVLCQVLEANALIQNGTQPKDMPEEFFSQEEPVNWKDGLQVNWQMMVIARLENQQRWEDAYALMKEAQAERKHIIGLLQKEIDLEMVFVCLITGRIDEARQLYTDDLRKYVKESMKTQSSKQRIFFATTLLLDGDREEAFRILKNLKEHRDDYILQGEVDMDIELMQLFE